MASSVLAAVVAVALAVLVWVYLGPVPGLIAVALILVGGYLFYRRRSSS